MNKSIYNERCITFITYVCIWNILIYCVVCYKNVYRA